MGNGSSREVREMTSENLVYAAYSGDLESVNNLLAGGINPNARNSIFMATALGMACSCHGESYEEIVKALLQAGANVDGIENKIGCTPLMIAAHQGNINIVRILLEAGADIFAKDFEGNNIEDYLSTSAKIRFSPNPKFIAETRQKIRELISPKMENYSQHFVMLIHIAESHLVDIGRREDREKIEQLSKKINESEDIIQGLADFLRLVIEMEDGLLIEAALQATPDRGLQEGDNNYRATGRQKIIARALLGAAVRGQTKIIETLSTLNGFYIDALDKEGRTALICAVEKGHLQAARALLRLGANVNAIGRFGKTPLHYAAAGTADSRLVRELINRGADIHALDQGRVRSLKEFQEGIRAGWSQWRFSVLEHAIIGKNLSAIRELIAAGVNINKKGMGGKRPLSFTIAEFQRHNDGGYIEVIVILLELGAKAELLKPEDKNLIYGLMGEKSSVMSNMSQIREAILQGVPDGVNTINQLPDNNIFFLGYDAAIMLKLFLPEDTPTNIRITDAYRLNEGNGQREFLRLKTFYDKLVLRFAEKDDPNPQLAAKTSILAFASHSTKAVLYYKTIFTKMAVSASAMQVNGLPASIIAEVIHDLAGNKIPGFTTYHTSAVIEVIMERVHPIRRPSSSPVLPKVENLVAAQLGAEEERKNGIML